MKKKRYIEKQIFGAQQKFDPRDFACYMLFASIVPYIFFHFVR